MGIEVLPPDVNASTADFAVLDGRIIFGLSAVKGCGGQAAEAIHAERLRGGPFRDMHDLCGRLDPSVVNRTAIESLAKAGALDALSGGLVGGRGRAAVLSTIEKAMAAGAAKLIDRKSGQKSLFESVEEASVTEPPASCDVPSLTDKEMRSFEKEVLGYYVHSHPLSEHESVLAAIRTHSTSSLSLAKPRSEVVVGGVIAALKLSNTKQARQGSTHTRYAMFDLEDVDGIVRTICWPEEFARLAERIEPDAIVIVTGTIDRRAGSEETNLIVNDLVPVSEAWRLPVRSLSLRISEKDHGTDVLDQIARIVKRYPGQVPLLLVLDLSDGRRVVMDIDGMRTGWSPEIHTDLTEHVGTSGVRVILAPRQRKGDAQPRSRSDRPIRTG